MTTPSEILKEISNTPYKQLCNNIGLELKQLRAEFKNHSNEHLLYHSPLLHQAFDFEAGLNEEAKSILSYYLPWQTVIQRNPQLVCQLLYSITGIVNSIETGPAKSKKVEGINTLNWVLDFEDQIGGIHTSENINYMIRFWAKDMEEVIKLQPGNAKRKFIEFQILPLFLPEDSDWDITIIPEFEIRKSKELLINEQLYA